MYLNQIVEARELASAVPRNITAADKGPWMVVQYVPALGTSGESATIAIATDAETMTFLVDSSAASGDDAIGTAGVIDLIHSDYDTMGELVDYINGRRAWRAYLVGALRTDVPSHLVNISASRCEGDNGLTMFSDTSDSKEISLAISGEKFVNNGVSGHLKDADDECVNEFLYGAFDVGDGTGTVTLKFYTGKVGSAEVQIGGSTTLVEDTQKLLGDANGTLPYLSAIRGERLIVRATSDSTFDAYVEFNVIGKTSVLKNDRVVDEANY